MLKYLLLLLTAISLPCFADNQAEAKVSHHRHKEFKWPTISYEGCYESESKMVLHSDGKVYFSSKVWTDSNEPKKWVNIFQFKDGLGDPIFWSEPYDFPMEKGKESNWSIVFTVDPGLYDEVESCKLWYEVI